LNLIDAIPPQAWVILVSFTPLLLVWCLFKGIRLWLGHRKRAR
jgi:hypothetical protein